MCIAFKDSGQPFGQEEGTDAALHCDLFGHDRQIVRQQRTNAKVPACDDQGSGTPTIASGAKETLFMQCILPSDRLAVKCLLLLLANSGIADAFDDWPPSRCSLGMPGDGGEADPADNPRRGGLYRSAGIEVCGREPRAMQVNVITSTKT